MEQLYYKKPVFDLLTIPRQRLRENKNWLCMICGDTGTGKSYTGLKIGESLDPHFSVDNVKFKVRDLLEAIRDSEKGQALIMDEAGVDFAARDFMKEKNKELSKIFQVFRFKNLYLIWTLPDMTMIDINARRLMHTYIETVRVDFKKEVSVVRWFQVLMKRREGETRYVLVRGIDSLGHKYRLDPVEIPKPSPMLVKDYERKKSEFFRRHLDKVIGGAVSGSLSQLDPNAPLGDLRNPITNKSRTQPVKAQTLQTDTEIFNMFEG